MPRARENREFNHLSRGMVLAVLQARANLAEGDLNSSSSYADEALLWSMVSRRYKQSRGMLRNNLTYLRDRGYVKFTEINVAGEKSLQWRITDTGVDLLEGNVKDDPGVAIE